MKTINKEKGQIQIFIVSEYFGYPDILKCVQISSSTQASEVFGFT